MLTTAGPRLHVRGRSGYIDVAEATGIAQFAALTAVLEAGQPAWTPSRPSPAGTGGSTVPRTSGPRCPHPRGFSASA